MAFDCTGSDQILAPAEHARAERYRFEEDRRRYVAGRVSLRRILAERTSTVPPDLVFEESENGKPRLVERPGTPPVHFNVSHSGDYAVIAVTTDAELGVDIEEMRPDCPVDDLARRFYSPHEARWLRSLRPRKRLEAFYQLWTIKEAVLKCAGVGLSVPPQSVRVRLSGNRPPTITCPDTRHKVFEQFQVIQLRLIGGYASALAVTGDRQPVGVLLVEP